MKTAFFVEYNGVQKSQDEIEAAIKKVWTDAGNKVSDIKSFEVYVQPSENKAYYVINSDFKGEYIL